jgi:hypothetical protein
METVTLAEVEAFRTAHYGGATARLVVAGPFDAQDVEKRIRAAFGDAPAAKAPEARPPGASRVTGTLVMGDAPSAVALAVPVPAPNDPLYAPFLVLAARIGPKGDFAPLVRPDLLFVTGPLPNPQQAEADAARMRAEVSATVGAPLGADEAARALATYGGALGAQPLGADAIAAAPFEAALAAGRRAQLAVDGKALAAAAGAVTQEQLAAAAKLFDAKSSAAVIAGGKNL